MAKAWIHDQWLKDAVVNDRRIPPTATMRRSLAANMANPDKAKVPAEHRSTRYGVASRWQLYWWGTRSDGRRVRHSRQFADYAKADAERAALEDDVRSSRYIDADDQRHTVDEVSDIWFAGLNHIKGSTYNRYRRDYDNHVRPRWGHVQVGKIKTSDINTWVSSMASGDATSCIRGPLTSESLYGVRAAFNAVLDLAVKNNWIAKNPLSDSSWPKRGASRPRVYLTVDQVRRLAANADKVTTPKGRPIAEGQGAFILFLAYTGLRLGEAIALQVGDVDTEARRISVTRTLSEERGTGLPIEATPKSGKSRRVPIPEFIIQEIAPLLSDHESNDYLFRSRRGGRLSETNWRNRVWKTAVAAAGLADVSGLTPHSLRHTYASIAIAHGADVKTLQNAMGHTSASMTLDTYADLWPDRLDDITRAIEIAWENVGHL